MIKRRIKKWCDIKRFPTRFRLHLQQIRHRNVAKCQPKKEPVDQIIIIYRISDKGLDKAKPTYITKEHCLRNAVKHFPPQTHLWLIVADNVREETYEMLRQICPQADIHRTAEGNSGSFRYAAQLAMRQDENAVVYFLEDDYVHRDNASIVLKEGFECGEAEWVSLYDHPDKYGYQKNWTNPFVWGGEKTKVFLTAHTHWKLTNSTPMTFAVRVKTLKREWSIAKRWCTAGKITNSYELFTDLQRKGRGKLITPIPSFSTHGESIYLAPLINWEDEINHST